jgi:hypothetical protein
MWREEWDERASGIRPRQWELLKQQGGEAPTRKRYCEAIKRFLEHAAERDWEKSGWGVAGLGTSLVETIDAAAEPDNSKRTAGFRDLIADLPVNVRGTLEDENSLRQAREFVSVLVKTFGLVKTKRVSLANEEKE